MEMNDELIKIKLKEILLKEMKIKYKLLKKKIEDNEKLKAEFAILLMN